MDLLRRGITMIAGRHEEHFVWLQVMHLPDASAGRFKDVHSQHRHNPFGIGRVGLDIDMKKKLVRQVAVKGARTGRI